MSINTFSIAETITVDIKHPSIGDYTNLQEAHNAASDGDTILVYPSDSSYPGIEVTIIKDYLDFISEYRMNLITGDSLNYNIYIFRILRTMNQNWQI